MNFASRAMISGIWNIYTTFSDRMNDWLRQQNIFITRAQFYHVYSCLVAEIYTHIMIEVDLIIIFTNVSIYTFKRTNHELYLYKNTAFQI